MLDGQQTGSESVDTAQCGPESVRTADDLTQALEMLRRRAARGTRRTRVSLDDIAARSRVPRSTVHSYLHGVRLPPPDVLDAIVVALGAHPHEQREWAAALERVVSGPGETEAPAAIDEVAASARVPHLLPMAPQGFRGREAELTELERHVSAAWAGDPGRTVLVGLCGTGGVGKTALALTCAHRVASRFPDGQLWIDLRGFGSGDVVDTSTALARLLSALGVDVSDLNDDVDFRADAYRSALDGRRVLVVLDNARDAAQVRRLLPGSPGCATLVTSRSNLRGLVVAEGAHRLDVARLSPADASALVGIDGQKASPDTVRTLVAACDGLPLALRILRERLCHAGHDQVRALAAQLTDRRARLRELEVEDEEDGFGLTAVIRSSYDALPADLARLLRRLTLIGASTFDTESAAAADRGGGPGVGRRLDGLAARNLLDPVGDGAHRLHDLIAAFAEARSESEDSAQDLTTAITALAAHYNAQLIEVSHIINPKGSAPDATPPTGRFADVEAATEWIVATLPAIAGLAANNPRSTDPQPVWDLLVRTFSVTQDHVGTACLDAVFASAAEDAGRRSDVVGECRLRQLEGIAAAGRGDTEFARASFERAVELSVDIEDLNRRADAIGNLGRLEIRTGRLTRALGLQTQALELRRRAGRDDDMIALTALADLHLQVGEMDASRLLREQVLDLAHAVSDPNMQATSLYHLGGIALSCHDLPAARRLAAQCVRAAVQSGVSSAVLSSHVLVAAVALADDDLRTAESQIFLAREIQVSEAADILIDLHVIAGRMLAATGRSAEALAEHRTAVRVARQMAVRFQETIALLNLARSLRRVGRSTEARAEADNARVLAATCGFIRLGGHADQLIDLLARDADC